MDDRWDQLQRIFREAAASAPEDRERFVRAACTDAAMCAEVEQLLAALDEGASFMEAPGVEHEAGPFEAPGYTIKRELGRGGMGVVYLAEREQPRGLVALKVLHAASATMRRRFEFEAEVLATLRHPGIAQVFEVGVASGARGATPFFAMEYVEGRPIREHAQSLDVDAVVELLARTADAVQHAHQLGVIHRDLKPHNILVTPEGQPKILDFGVARVIGRDVTTMQTEVGQLLGTLAYMSPEQVGGDPSDIDTRSDVYALGVIAYELLAGRMPYDLGQLPDAARVIRHDEPSRLSTHNPACRGDLETIIAKALEKDRARRYASAGELASDLRRFRNDEPIAARPQSRSYVLRKLVRRHRVLATAGASAAAVLVIGATASTLLAIQLSSSNDKLTAALADVEEAKVEVEARAATSQRINEFFARHVLLAAAPEETLGEETTLLEALNAAASSVDVELAGEPEAAAYVHRALASVFRRLGAGDRVLEHSEASMHLYRQSLGADHAETLHAMSVHAQNLQDAARYDEAEQLRGEALPRLVELLGDDHPYTVTALSGRAGLLSRQGRWEEAVVAMEQVIATGVGEPESQVNNRVQLSEARQSAGDLDGSLEALEEARIIAERDLPPDHPLSMSILNSLGAVYMGRDEPEKALPIIQEVADRSARILGRTHMNAVIARQNYARTLASVGRFKEAEPLWIEVIGLAREQLPEAHPLIGFFERSYGIALMENGRPGEADAHLTAAYEVHLAAFGPSHPETQRSIRWIVELHTRTGSEQADVWRAMLEDQSSR